MPFEDSDITKILEKDELSLNEVKKIMRWARYSEERDGRLDYADSIMPDASQYLRPHTLRALVRADFTNEFTEADVVRHIDLNKSIFSRLTKLLPPLIRFFSPEARRRNIYGIVSMIDDCLNDFHFTVVSPRRDRQLREAKEKLADALNLALECAAALEASQKYFDIEHPRYRAAYFEDLEEHPAYSIRDLVTELQVCAGTLEIIRATADTKPDRLFLSGNDHRTEIVEWAYHMSTMWGGPRLVTTPGSDFAALCSLLFEAATGHSDEGLAGAINRYARSSARKQWDSDGENQDEFEWDNFQSERLIIASTAREIALSEELLGDPSLSLTAKLILSSRINREEQRRSVAGSRYGPRQVYSSQMSQKQVQETWESVLKHSKLKEAERPASLYEFMKWQAASDVKLGRHRRSQGDNKN